MPYLILSAGITMSEQEIKFLFGSQEDREDKYSRALDYPAAQTYCTFLPDEIEVLCNTFEVPLGTETPPWETQNLPMKLYYVIKAYWVTRGAINPSLVAAVHFFYLTTLGHSLSNLQVIPEAEFMMINFLTCCQFNPEELRSLDQYSYESIPEGQMICRFIPENLRDLEHVLSKFIPDSEKPNVQLIIDRCPQMAMIHALRGDVSEPYWWAILSITEHATPNLSRKCSDGYPGFSDEELEYRVGRIHNEGLKPARCDRLDMANPKVCGLCKFKGVIRSPMALGYEHEPRLNRGQYE